MLHPDFKEFDNWFYKQIQSSTSLKKILEVSRTHKQFYESLELQKCAHNNRTTPYSESCIKYDDTLKKEIVTFWNETILQELNSPEFMFIREVHLNEDIEKYYKLSPSERLVFKAYDELFYYYNELIDR